MAMVLSVEERERVAAVSHPVTLLAVVESVVREHEREAEVRGARRVARAAVAALRGPLESAAARVVRACDEELQELG